jgi:hypothetical protein
MGAFNAEVEAEQTNAQHLEGVRRTVVKTLRDLLFGGQDRAAVEGEQ